METNTDINNVTYTATYIAESLVNHNTTLYSHFTAWSSTTPPILTFYY